MQKKGVSLASRERNNQRWTQEQLDRLRTIQGARPYSTIFRAANQQARYRMLRLHPDGDMSGGKPAVFKISQDWQERIREKTRSGNQRLIDRWNLPLGKYGYQV